MGWSHFFRGVKKRNKYIKPITFSLSGTRQKYHENFGKVPGNIFKSMDLTIQILLLNWIMKLDCNCIMKDPHSMNFYRLFPNYGNSFSMNQCFISYYFRKKKLSMNPNKLLKFIQYRRSRKAASPNWSELEEKVRKDSVKVEVVFVHFLAAQTQWGARGHRPNRAKGQARNQGRSEGVTS